MATESHIVSLLEDPDTLGFNEVRLRTAATELFKENPRLKHTVELFCFGDYTHYTTHREEYIDLSSQALHKLKQLTLASEALKSNRLRYTDLQTKLSFPSKLDLEVFLAECLYAKVIDATLVSHQSLVKVKSSHGRDVLLDDEAEKERLKEEYGAMTVSDLVQGLKKFGGRIDDGQEYIVKLSGGEDEQQQQEEEEEQPVAGTPRVYAEAPFEADETPGEQSDQSSGDESDVSDVVEGTVDQANSEAGASESSTSRKRKIDAGK